jgi:hypothetical protein
LYHYILSRVDLCSKIKYNFFDSKELQFLYQVVQPYVIKYKEAPTAIQVKDILKVENKDEIISFDAIDIIYNTKKSLSEYGEDWLENTTINWAKWSNFTLSVRNLVAYVKGAQVTEDNVDSIMEHAKSLFNNDSIIEFNESPGSDLYDAFAHKPSKLVRSSVGYDYIDKCLKGGCWEGSLIVFMGAPKSGKSLWLQNLCAKSIIAGNDCAYISLELPEEMIMSRIGSNLFNIPALQYEQFAEDETYMKQKITTFLNDGIKPRGNLWVKFFPASTMTTTDLENCLLREEERRSTPDKPFKFKMVFIDYINIMKNWRNPNSENTYLKIKNLAEDLKAIGAINKWAMFTATQSKREAADSTDMNVADTSESYGLNATVDAMFGIIVDPMMKAQGVYHLKCLLDRVCPMENTYKKFINDKTYLRISEDELEPYKDCSAVFNNVGGSYKKSSGYAPQQTDAQVQSQTQVQSNNGVMFEDMIPIKGKDLFSQ